MEAYGRGQEEGSLEDLKEGKGGVKWYNSVSILLVNELKA